MYLVAYSSDFSKPFNEFTDTRKFQAFTDELEAAIFVFEFISKHFYPDQEPLELIDFQTGFFEQFLNEFLVSASALADKRIYFSVEYFSPYKVDTWTLNEINKDSNLAPCIEAYKPKIDRLF